MKGYVGRSAKNQTLDFGYLLQKVVVHRPLGDMFTALILQLRRDEIRPADIENVERAAGLSANPKRWPAGVAIGCSDNSPARQQQGFRSGGSCLSRGQGDCAGYNQGGGEKVMRSQCCGRSIARHDATWTE